MNELCWFSSFGGLVADPGGNGGGPAGVIRAGASCFVIATSDRDSGQPDDARPYAARDRNAAYSNSRNAGTDDRHTCGPSNASYIGANAYPGLTTGCDSNACSDSQGAKHRSIR